MNDRTTAKAAPAGHINTAIAAVMQHAIDHDLPVIAGLRVGVTEITVDVPASSYSAWRDSIIQTEPEHKVEVPYGPLAQVYGGPVDFAEAAGTLPDLGIRVRLAAFMLRAAARPVLQAVQS